ncbi:alpha/beta hydrolase-fold protein [Robertmurraya sp.]|uniref:alpha/beta hydrolase-fold protein n=1 Tax=Robertmurraya sp. TaxID=2837525 RepID=UPI003704498F
MKSLLKRYMYFLLIAIFITSVLALPVSAQDIGVNVENGVKKEGVTVNRDNHSPTGYTATFVYKNETANSVQFYGQFQFANPGVDYPIENVPTYSPEEWTKEMFPLNMSTPYVKEMTKVEGTDFWTISMPLPSGGYPYSYIVDGVTIADPSNMPIANQDTGKQNLSMAYVPFDSKKQSFDYSYVLPKKGAKTGSVSFETYSTSGLLTTDQSLGIYLPHGYDPNRNEPYKVIYLSHGGGGNEADWFNTGSAANILDNLIAQKKTEPVIVVTMNNSVFGWDMAKITKNMMENIIPFMESNYHVSKDSNDRAFAGLSMGALTTTNIYYSNPTNFGYFGIFSGADARVDLSNYNLDDLRKPKLFVAAAWYDMAYHDVGFNSEINTLKFMSVLDANQIPYEFENVNGAHDWFTWPQLLNKFLTDVVWK